MRLEAFPLEARPGQSGWRWPGDEQGVPDDKDRTKMLFCQGITLKSGLKFGHFNNHAWKPLFPSQPINLNSIPHEQGEYFDPHPHGWGQAPYPLPSKVNFFS
jgi:hypothetical protein